jgi:hypothetical protein
MENLPKTLFFYKSFKHLLKGKLTAREVLIIGIIADFADSPKGCFIGRSELAKLINESEATAERAVQLLLSEGYLKATRVGRKRYLSLTNLYQPDTSQPADLYQNDTQSVSKQGVNLYQPDTLLRSITQISYSDLITRSRSEYSDLQLDQLDHTSNNLDQYTEQKGEAMAQQSKLKTWWEGLSDFERQDLLAQVDVFGSVFEKKLCDPNTLTGLSILYKLTQLDGEDANKTAKDGQD